MNRRNFFKAVTGFIAGMFVGSAKAKPQLTVAMLQKAKKDLDTHWTKIEPEEELICHGGYLFRVYPYQDDGVYVILRRENICMTRILEKYMFSRIGFRRMHFDDMINCFESFRAKHKV